jgi:8-oxo-dGTP pyrophosphatase MutT (NUDIX family)
LSEPYWKVRGRRTLYESEWVNLRLYDVELPDGRVIEHHACEHPFHAVGVVPVLPDGRILLVDHYRFICGTRGFEIPSGRMEAGESPETAGARELIEETAHEASSLRHVGKFNPSNGISDQVFHVVVARGVAPRAGAAYDTNEISGLAAFALEEIVAMAVSGRVPDGLTLAGLFLAEKAGALR